MITEQFNWNEYLNNEKSLNTMTYINNVFKLDDIFKYEDGGYNHENIVNIIGDFKIMGERYLNQTDTLNCWLFDPDYNVDQMNLNIDRINKCIDQIDYILPKNTDAHSDIVKYIDLINYKDSIINAEYDIIYSNMDWEEESTDEEDYNCCLLWARTEYVKQIYINVGEFSYNKILTKHFGAEFDEAAILFEEYKLNFEDDGLIKI